MAPERFRVRKPKHKVDTASVSPKKKCRTCLAHHNYWMASIFERENGSDAAYSTMISTVAGVEVSEGDGLPFHICSNCRQCLTVAYQYRLQARKVDQELRSLSADPIGGTDPVPQDSRDSDETSDRMICEENKINKTVDNFFKVNCEKRIKIEKTSTVVKVEFIHDRNDDFEMDLPMDDHLDNDDIVKQETKTGIADRCNICDEHLGTKVTLQNHTCLKVEVEIKQNYCPVCGLSFPSAPALLQHARSAHRQLTGARRTGPAHRAPVRKSLRGGATVRESPVTEKCSDESAYVQGVLDAPCCGICNSGFETRDKLAAHYKYHGGAAILSCALCGTKFLERIYLNRHYSSRHPDADVNKMAAGKSNYIFDLIATHKSRGSDEKSQELDFSVCPLCGVLLLSRDELSEHNRVEHPGFRSRCEFCARIYTKAKLIKVHQRFCGQSMPHVRCDVCKQTYLRKNIEKHVLTQHTEAAGVACNICGKRVKTHKQLATHKNRTHNISKIEQRFECDICQKQLADKYSMRKHLEVHDPNRPLAELKLLCLYCGLRTRFHRDLLVHIRRHHTHEKPNKCTLCDMAFVRSSCLKQHMRKHTGERPYKCDVCGKAFFSSDSRVRHMRIHSGERPYKCPHCDRAFTQRGDMRTHALRHTGGARNRCECGEGFAKAADLRQHKMDVHESRSTSYDPHVAVIKDQMQTARALNNDSYKDYAQYTPGDP